MGHITRSARRGTVVTVAALSLAAASVLPALADANNLCLGGSCQAEDNDDNSVNTDNSVTGSYNEDSRDLSAFEVRTRLRSMARNDAAQSSGQFAFISNWGFGIADTGGNRSIGVADIGDMDQDVGDQEILQGSENATGQMAQAEVLVGANAQGDTSTGDAGDADADSGGQTNGNVGVNVGFVGTDGEAGSGADSGAASQAGSENEAAGGDGGDGNTILGISAGGGDGGDADGSSEANSDAASDATSDASTNASAAQGQDTSQNAQQANEDEATATGGSNSSQAVGHIVDATGQAQGGTNDNATIQDQAALNEGSVQMRGGNSGASSVTTGDATAVGNDATTSVNQTQDLRQEVEQRTASRFEQMNTRG